MKYIQLDDHILHVLNTCYTCIKYMLNITKPCGISTRLADNSPPTPLSHIKEMHEIIIATVTNMLSKTDRMNTYKRSELKTCDSYAQTTAVRL